MASIFSSQPPLIVLLVGLVHEQVKFGSDFLDVGLQCGRHFFDFVPLGTLGAFVKEKNEQVLLQEGEVVVFAKGRRVLFARESHLLGPGSHVLHVVENHECIGPTDTMPEFECYFLVIEAPRKTSVVVVLLEVDGHFVREAGVDEEPVVEDDHF
jgi:hypothetical protein